MTCPFYATEIYSSKLSASLAAGKSEKMDATLLVTIKGMWGWKMKKKHKIKLICKAHFTVLRERPEAAAVNILLL